MGYFTLYRHHGFTVIRFGKRGIALLPTPNPYKPRTDEQVFLHIFSFQLLFVCVDWKQLVTPAFKQRTAIKLDL